MCTDPQPSCLGLHFPTGHSQVRGGKSARGGMGGVGMTPGRSPAYGLLASPHPNRMGGMPQQNVLASPSRQGGGGGPGGPPGSGMFSGRVSTNQVRAVCLGGGWILGKAVCVQTLYRRGVVHQPCSPHPTLFDPMAQPHPV